MFYDDDDDDDDYDYYYYHHHHQKNGSSGNEIYTQLTNGGKTKSRRTHWGRANVGMCMCAARGDAQVDKSPAAFNFIY